MSPGDINIHNGEVAHCSQDNSDSNTRISVAVVYVPDGTRFTLTPEQHSGKEGEELRKELMETFFNRSRCGELVEGTCHPKI